MREMRSKRMLLNRVSMRFMIVQAVDYRMVHLKKESQEFVSVSIDFLVMNAMVR